MVFESGVFWSWHLARRWEVTANELLDRDRYGTGLELEAGCGGKVGGHREPTVGSFTQT